MKKWYLLIVFAFFANYAFPQMTSLDLLKLIVKETIQTEIVKDSYFGKGLRNYPDSKFHSISIIDVTTVGGKLTIDGEFSYYYDLDNNSEWIIKTVKYQATVKQILDDFAVIKVVFQMPYTTEWHKLFPKNSFNSNN